MTLYEYSHGAANPDHSGVLERWNTKTEKMSEPFPKRRAGNEYTSLNQAKRDFQRLKNINPSASAVFIFCDGTREEIRQDV